MIGHNQQPEPARLEQALEALRSTPVPEGPSPDLVASTLGALQPHVAPAGMARTHERRRLMFRIAGYSGVAATVLALGGLAGFCVFCLTPALTFAEVVQNVKDAKTVSFTVKQKLGNQPELESKMGIRGDIIRYELADALIMIVDTSKRKGIELDLTRKVAKAIDLEGAVPAEVLQNPIEQLRNLKESNKDRVEQQNDEELDGHKCQVYSVKGARAGILPDRFKLWADAKTGLPVKIHATDDDGKTSLLFENFAWDKPLADDLLSMAVPRGFTLEAFTPAEIKPGRIYYHRGGRDLYSVQPDGKNGQTQFMPQFAAGGAGFVSDRSELSPDGRFLAVGFTSSRQHGMYPPDRVLLWDRTHPTEKPAEIQPRPEVELQSWQWSGDGARLYVSWWEADHGQKEGKGRYDAAVVDIKTKEVQALKLPNYADEKGQQQTMRFAAASADGQTLLAIGQGLHVATTDGKALRRISSAKDVIMPASVRISPDGKQVLYATFHQDLSQQLYVAPLAGGEPKELIGAKQMTEIQACWSPDSQRIAYTCRLYDSQHSLGHGKEKYLRLVNADGSGLTTLLTEQIHPNGSGLELIAWR
jgi:outer membrane lipoprotein-sorting protein